MPVSEDMMKHIEAEPVFLFLTQLGLILRRLALSRKSGIFSICY